MRLDFTSLLAARVRTRPGDPLVTYVDATTGERTELSAVSLANAAAKIGNALLDEFDLLPDDPLRLALPAHWQLAAWCAGAWTAGVPVSLDDTPVPALVVATSTTAEQVKSSGMDVQVVSMHPFGLPIAEPLPAGCHDVTIAVRQQPDAFLHPPAASASLALVSGERRLTQADLVDAALATGREWGVQPGDRLLVPGDLEAESAVLACIAVPLACDASSVIVRAEDRASLTRIAAQERTSPSAAPLP